MQDENQTFSHRPVSRPAGEPHQVQQSGEAKRDSDEWPFLDEHPVAKATALTAMIATRGDRRVKAALGIFSRQPLARETRNDPAADQGDQQHHDRDADSNAVVCRAAEMSFKMEGAVSGKHNATSTTTLRLRQFFPARISRPAAATTSARKPTSIAAAGNHPTSAEIVMAIIRRPRQDERQQRLSLDRKLPRPIRDRGEEKARDHRRQIAVKHLMDMPVPRG